MTKDEMIKRATEFIDKGYDIEILVETMYEMWSDEVDEKHRLMIDNLSMRTQLEWADDLTNNMYGKIGDLQREIKDLSAQITRHLTKEDSFQ